MKRVSVILGSDSDLDICADAVAVLDELRIHHEKRILSAHRTPDELASYVRSAEKNGVLVFIAIAGMAAALPGVVAACTTLPVIGVPVAGKSSVMGFDSLLSMVQMPPGVPVAVVALNGGKNAALLAAEILALGDPSISTSLKSYREKLKKGVLEKNRKLQDEA
jgi:5-(carboxyamino)imidazole ribonucleotide mutase